MSWMNQFWKKTVGDKTFILPKIPRLIKFGTNCRSRKVGYTLMSWMNKIWNKLWEPKRLFYPKYLDWSSLVQTVGAEKWHTPWCREWINFWTNCRCQNIYHTYITTTEKLWYKLQEQKSGIHPNVVNESNLKETVKPKRLLYSYYLDSTTLVQTVGAKTLIILILPRLKNFGTNCRSEKMAYILMSWMNQFSNKL